MRRHTLIPLVIGLALMIILGTRSVADEVTVHVKTPMSPPAWALLERELLKANAAACEEFFDRYFDERGYLQCVERWGGDDGPDDAIENCNDWPLLHALGGPDVVLKLYKKAWEGHLRQYTAAKTTHVPFAKDGMYYKEFPVTFDWLHNGEGLTVFNLQGLSDPNDPKFQQRVRRFAGFYMNEDPQAPNYDPKHKIIKSMFNGSRGPLLRKATALDWAGDPIEVAGRFKPGHGEQSYEQMLEHFKEYTDIVGDHPLNLQATSLALNAYMLTHEDKYKAWLLEYVDAWRERMAANNDIIPSNIGLDGKIGGAADGKWYGGTYGWGFTMRMPPDGRPVNRNQAFKGFLGFMNAYFLTGDDRYLDAWRKQSDAVNAQKKVIDGKDMFPTMHGDKGWYAFEPRKFNPWAREIWYLSMRETDRARLGDDRWLTFLDGKDAKYPEQRLRGDLERVRQRVAAMRQDTTTPDTRLADDPMQYNPASVESLVELALGGVHPGHVGSILHCRLRYFDPERRRAGLPDDVAALVEKLTADQVTVTLVNVNQLAERTVVVQGGGYGEHLVAGVKAGDQDIAVNAARFSVRLAAGAGTQLVLRVRRYSRTPTLAMPWDAR